MVMAMALERLRDVLSGSRHCYSSRGLLAFRLPPKREAGIGEKRSAAGRDVSVPRMTVAFGFSVPGRGMVPSTNAWMVRPMSLCPTQSLLENPFPSIPYLRVRRGRVKMQMRDWKPDVGWRRECPMSPLRLGRGKR
jgi:hypothetical protein